MAFKYSLHAVLLVLALLAGCTSTPPVPIDRFYQLSVNGNVKAYSGPVLNGSVAVEALITDGLRNGRAILFSDINRSLELRQYHYHYWIDPPPRLVQEHLISFLRKTNAANLVITRAPASKSDYVISGKIRQYEQVKQGGKSLVVINLELHLKKEGSSQLLLVKDYQERLQIDNDTMHEIAKGFSVALEKIYRRFLDDVRNTLT